MTPVDLLIAVLCYCGVVAAVVATFALCAVFLVLGLAAAGLIVESLSGAAEPKPTVIRMPTVLAGGFPAGDRNPPPAASE